MATMIRKMANMSKIFRYYCFFAGALLLTLSLAKFISASGVARLLNTPDPILVISFKHVLEAVGVFEAVIGCICIFAQGTMLKAKLIAWLSSCFVIYRLGYLCIDYKKPCPCLGNLTGAIHISQSSADAMLKAILVYLLVGSYAILVWHWQEKKNGSRLLN
jgi:hypothetical protein